MKYIETVVSICLAAAGLAGCEWHNPTAPSMRIVGSGVVVTDTRPIGPVSAVSVAGAGHLIIDRNGPETLEIAAEDNILPYLRVEVVNGRLMVGPGPGSNFSTTRRIVYRLGVRALEEIEASGASLIESANIDTDRLTVLLSGASSAGLSGAASRLVVQASGASRAVVDGVQSPDVRVALSGSSYARVRSSGRLTVSASGTSVLEYFGDPILVTDVSGMSTVRRIGP